MARRRPRGLLRSSIWSPSRLFVAAGAGAWYDPSDLTTMYKISGGSDETQGLSAVGDTVGMILDKSQGQTLGPELIVNGTFDTDLTGWSVDGAFTMTWNAGVVTVDGINEGSWFGERFHTTSAVTTDNEVYCLSFRARLISGVSALRITENSKILKGIVLTGSWQSFDVTFKAKAAGFLNFFSNGSISKFELDDISLKKIAGTHLWQETLSKSPILRKPGDFYYLEFDGTDDYLETTAFSALSQPTSIYLAGKHDAVVDKYFYDGIAAGNRHALFPTGGTPNWILHAGSDSANLTAPDNSDHVYGALFNTTSSFLRIDGSQSATISVGTHTLTGLTLGARYDVGNGLVGRVYGLVFRNSSLSAEDISNLEGWLAEKAGISGL